MRRLRTSSPERRPYVSGSSPVAICRGFYDYLTANGYGTVTWSGSRIRTARPLPRLAARRVVSPFRHRLYYNVCTNGYTTPYWGWQEWEKEIDWMALHDSTCRSPRSPARPFSPACGARLGAFRPGDKRLFHRPGPHAVDAYGQHEPAGRAPSQAWHEAQIALQHKIVDRGRETRHEARFSGFRGLRPQGDERALPRNQPHYHPLERFQQLYALTARQPFSPEIAKRYIETWEAEFGKGTYYLIDSFNELDIPFGDQGKPGRFDLLQSYSKGHLQCASEARQSRRRVGDAGVGFSATSVIWGPQSIEALLSGVPDDRMLIIDLAVDFNRFVWQSKKDLGICPRALRQAVDLLHDAQFRGAAMPYGGCWKAMPTAISRRSATRRGALVGYGTSPGGRRAERGGLRTDC